MPGFPHSINREFHNVPRNIRMGISAIMSLSDESGLEIITEGKCHIYQSDTEKPNLDLSPELHSQTIMANPGADFDAALSLKMSGEYFFFNNRMFTLKNGTVQELGKYVTPCDRKEDIEKGLFLI